MEAVDADGMTVQLCDLCEAILVPTGSHTHVTITHETPTVDGSTYLGDVQDFDLCPTCADTHDDFLSGLW